MNDGIIRDALFLKEQDWPMWPVCPVKRYVKGESWPKLGVVWAGTTTVLTVNLYELGGLNFEQAKERAEAVDKYETFEGMITDGWMVD